MAVALRVDTVAETVVKSTVVGLKRAGTEATAVVPVEVILEATAIVLVEVTLEATAAVPVEVTLGVTIITTAHLEAMEAAQEVTVEVHNLKASTLRARHMVVEAAMVVIQTTLKGQLNMLHLKAVNQAIPASSVPLSAC